MLAAKTSFLIRQVNPSHARGGFGSQRSVSMPAQSNEITYKQFQIMLESNKNAESEDDEPGPSRCQLQRYIHALYKIAHQRHTTLL